MRYDAGMLRALAALSLLAVPGCAASGGQGPTLERVRVAPGGKSFVLDPSGLPFVPWGFNYDHDEPGRLLEDYWEQEWPRVEEDFREMKALGANLARIHLQVGRFMEGPDRPDGKALARLGKLVDLADQVGLYLDLTGLGCYHKKDVPSWYDALDEEGRWGVQVRFWEAIAGRCAGRPAVFCYDLMNEPVVPGGDKKGTDWLGPPFAGKHFVQYVSLERKGRPRPDVAGAWAKRLVAAIRRHDPKTLVTVGLVDWSLDRPGLSSGFVPSAVAPELDFLSVHLYPKGGKVDEALETLRGFAVGKPVLIEETFTLGCGLEDFRSFVERSSETACGWVGFYWGKTPEECRQGKSFQDALMAQWLDYFRAGPPPRRR